MIKDEYNQIHIKNEREVTKVEFGKTQKTEYSASKESLYNKTTKEEINNTPSSLNKDTNNKPREPKHLSVTEAIKSISTSSVASTVVAATSVVAVATVSTLVGINIYVYAKCSFQSLNIFDQSINYVLKLDDTNNDTYILSLSNSEYYQENSLVEGLNEGYFSGLMPEETYKLCVVNTSYNDYVLYESYITTLAKGSSLADPIFNSFSITQKVGISDKYVEIDVDFVDTDNVISSFKLDLTSQNQTFSLPYLAQTGTQFANLEEALVAGEEYRYSFSYYDLRVDDYVEYENGTITFINLEEDDLSFYLNDKADLATGDIYFTITIFGDSNNFGNFILVLSDSLLIDETRYEFAISESDIVSGEETTINVLDQIDKIALRDSEFDYSFEYDYQDSHITDPNLSGHIKFSDYLDRSSYMNGVSLLYKEGSIVALQIDYQDDFDIYSNFRLSLDDGTGSSSLEFVLNENNEIQEIEVEGQEQGSDAYYNFQFTYYNSEIGEDQIQNGDAYLEEKLRFDSLYSSFNVTVFDDKYYIPVIIYYSDYFNTYESMSIYMTCLGYSANMTSELAATHNWQYLEITDLYYDETNDMYYDPAETELEISYEVKSKKVGEEEYQGETVGAGTITKDGMPSLIAAYTASKEIEEDNPIMSLYLIYTDYDKIANEFELVFEIPNNDSSYSVPFTITERNLTEYISIDLTNCDNYEELIEALQNYPTMLKVQYNNGDEDIDYYIYEEETYFSIV